jgi:hypothetical protein
MSGIEDLSLEASPVLTEEEEEQARKKARKLISEAFISAGRPLDNRGVKAQLLPGLWYATMTVLTTLLTGEEALAFLQAKHQTVHGFGDNADSPPKSFDDDVLMQRYIAKVSMAAQTIMDKLMEALEEMERFDIDDRFVETVFDVALMVLMPAWGPDHIRRAIMEQCSQIIIGLPEGKIEIRNFMEPERFLSPPEKPKGRRTPDNSEPVVEKVVAELRVKRQATDRTISCFIGTERLDDGRSSWAIVMRIVSGAARIERRDVYGSIEDKTGNKVALKLIHELALAICLEDGVASVDVRLTDPAIQRLMPDQTDSPVDTQRFDESVWNEIAACFARHHVSSRIVNISLSDDQQERCDKLLKNPDR